MADAGRWAVWKNTKEPSLQAGEKSGGEMSGRIRKRSPGEHTKLVLDMLSAMRVLVRKLAREKKTEKRSISEWGWGEKK